jgi:hypothetical protein
MPAKLDRCVRKVESQGTVRNPWTVCVAAIRRADMKKKKHRAKKTARRSPKKRRVSKKVLMKRKRALCRKILGELAAKGIR